jgi:hypothetical protein
MNFLKNVITLEIEKNEVELFLFFSITNVIKERKN